MAENGTLECANEGSRFPSWLSPSHINWLPKNIPTPTPLPLFPNSPECPSLRPGCKWSLRTLGCSWGLLGFPPCYGTTGIGTSGSPHPPHNAVLLVCPPGQTGALSIWAWRASLHGTQENHLNVTAQTIASSHTCTIEWLWLQASWLTEHAALSLFRSLIKLRCSFRGFLI